MHSRSLRTCGAAIGFFAPSRLRWSRGSICEVAIRRSQTLCECVEIAHIRRRPGRSAKIYTSRPAVQICSRISATCLHHRRRSSVVTGAVGQLQILLETSSRSVAHHRRKLAMCRSAANLLQITTDLLQTCGAVAARMCAISTHIRRVSAISHRRCEKCYLATMGERSERKPDRSTAGAEGARMQLDPLRSMCASGAHTLTPCLSGVISHPCSATGDERQDVRV